VWLNDWTGWSSLGRARRGREERLGAGYPRKIRSNSGLSLRSLPTSVAVHASPSDGQNLRGPHHGRPRCSRSSAGRCPEAAEHNLLAGASQGWIVTEQITAPPPGASLLTAPMTNTVIGKLRLVGKTSAVAALVGCPGQPRLLAILRPAACNDLTLIKLALQHRCAPMTAHL
jgi:hypothetical protein